MTKEQFTYDEFLSFFSVSRETYNKLALYVSLIEKWQISINLVSNKTLPMIWRRHILDSFQLVELLPSTASILDLGSGAGLPGLVFAVAGHNVTLVESDGKKAAFLRECVRLLEVNANVLCQRVEALTLCDYQTLTARAFAPVRTILQYLANKLNITHSLLLLKGKNWEQEIAEARQQFDFDVRVTSSRVNEEGVALSLTNIHNRGA